MGDSLIQEFEDSLGQARESLMAIQGYIISRDRKEAELCPLWKMLEKGSLTLFQG